MLLTHIYSYSSIRNNQVSADIKEMLSKKQAEVQDSIKKTEYQAEVITDTLDQLQIKDSNDEDEDASEAIAEAKEGAQKLLMGQQEAINVSMGLFEALEESTQEDAIKKAAEKSGVVINIKFGHHNTGIQANNIYGGISNVRFGR